MIIPQSKLCRKGGIVFLAFAPPHWLVLNATCLSMTNDASRDRDHFRHDGVRMTHDPYAPGMVEKYGRPGRTDGEGFDPYADSVGPGIYGGIVSRHPPGHPRAGGIVVGR